MFCCTFRCLPVVGFCLSDAEPTESEKKTPSQISATVLLRMFACVIVAYACTRFRTAAGAHDGSAVMPVLGSFSRPWLNDWWASFVSPSHPRSPYTATKQCSSRFTPIFVLPLQQSAMPKGNRYARIEDPTKSRGVRRREREKREARSGRGVRLKKRLSRLRGIGDYKGTENHRDAIMESYVRRRKEERRKEREAEKAAKHDKGPVKGRRGENAASLRRVEMESDDGSSDLDDGSSAGGGRRGAGKETAPGSFFPVSGLRQVHPRSTGGSGSGAGGPRRSAPNAAPSRRIGSTSLY